MPERNRSSIKGNSKSKQTDYLVSLLSSYWGRGGGRREMLINHTRSIGNVCVLSSFPPLSFQTSAYWWTEMIDKIRMNCKQTVWNTLPEIGGKKDNMVGTPRMTCQVHMCSVLDNGDPLWPLLPPPTKKGNTRLQGILDYIPGAYSSIYF